MDYQEDYCKCLYFRENAEAFNESKDFSLKDIAIWMQLQIMGIIRHLFNDSSRILSSDSWEEIFDTLKATDSAISLSSWQSQRVAFAINWWSEISVMVKNGGTGGSTEKWCQNGGWQSCNEEVFTRNKVKWYKVFSNIRIVNGLTFLPISWCLIMRKLCGHW